MKNFTTLGMVGLGVHLSVNVVAMLVFKKASAEFFSGQWWSSWFPTYNIWFMFLVIGLANRRKNCGGGKSCSRR
jgi:hypothetical protein